ncbi:MAG: CDGSH iron-sulfur domain-containing protein [Candidatus Micrarchaeia archaeon]
MNDKKDSGCPKIKIKAMKDGPNVVTVDDKVKFALCRCGHSANKPFCDGTHHKIEFKAEEKELSMD